MTEQGEGRTESRKRTPEGPAVASGPLGRFRPRRFRPAPWLPGPHLQTLGGHFLRPSRPVPFRRRRWTTPDGDFLELDFVHRPGGPGKRAGRVLLLHGLEGSSRSGYVLETARRLYHLGIPSVAMNFRSCSGEPNRRARFYHSGETGDLAFVLRRFRRLRPDDPLAVVGFSLGGNVLLKFLAEQGAGARTWVDAAVAVSVPFDLEAGARALARGWGRLYGRHFLRSLRRTVHRKARRFPNLYDTDRLRGIRTLREFDDAFTAPLHGFLDARDYYVRSSSGPRLGDVRVPTLLLQAHDDPFLPEDALPVRAAESNPHVRPVFTRRGGHVGFVTGPPWKPRFWAETEAARFLARALNAEGPAP